jgi:hypothetical protein
MKISAQKSYAVITGDIVDSSKLAKAERQKLPTQLRRASRETRKAFADAVPLEAALFRGDGWQLLVTDPARSFRIGLYFRACLRSETERGRGLDTRLAIAVGGIDFLPGGNISQGDGEAYRASGRALEEMPKKQRLVLATPGEDSPLGVVALLVDALAQRWTGKQARAVMGALRGWTQEKIAKSWPEPIAQPTVVKHLENAQWAAVEQGISYVERSFPPLGETRSEDPVRS